MIETTVRLQSNLLSWNRCSYVKDPSTGKRQARVNPNRPA
jgi:hypothetical protein